MPKLNKEHLSHLGTETAYAVSAEAAAHRAAGNTVHSFHIGDLNFKTPKAIINACQEAIANGKTGYPPAKGVNELLNAMAETLGKERGVELTPANIAVQPGGKPTISKFFHCTMQEGDHVLGPAPAYPIYESLVNFMGGVYDYYMIIEKPDGSYGIDMDMLRSKITDKTKVLIYNNYHNPTGACSSQEEMEEIARLANEHDLWVLSDEAYFHIVYDEVPKSIIALPGMLERTVILFTCSKSWAMTGWRCGCAIGPAELITNVVRLTTNDEACTCHFVQYAAVAALTDPSVKEEHNQIVAVLRKRRDLINKLLNEVPGFRAPLPPSTFYFYTNVTKAMEMLGVTGYEEFRKRILQDVGVSFCTREHFGQSAPEETEKYIRFAFSGIDEEEITVAFGKLKDYFSALESK